MKKKVAFHTLGCKLNFSESSTILRTFIENGFEKVNFDEKADVYVINTCSVTSMADKKCRQIIKKAIKTAPTAFVAVIGCYSQLNPDEIAQIEGVDLVVGTNDKFKLLQLIEKVNKNSKPNIHSCDINQIDDFYSSFSIGGRTRSFLKIQDGCDYKCTYCTIPLARGKSRSDTIDNIILETQSIINKGFKEIVFTGVNIGDFGKTTGENLFDLLQQIVLVKGLERLRISSIEPNLLNDKIVSLAANSNIIMPHFHIPLQSGSNKILGLMRRRYNRELFAERITLIKSLIPDAFIGVDVIVGFPQETDELFQDAFEFIESLDLSYLHVFPYSARPNTIASTMAGSVPDAIVSQRVDRLIRLSEIKHFDFYNRHIGKKTSVLFESQKVNDRMFGFTPNYIKVETKFNEKFINQIIPVRLEKINNNSNFEISFEYPENEKV